MASEMDVGVRFCGGLCESRKLSFCLIAGYWVVEIKHLEFVAHQFTLLSTIIVKLTNKNNQPHRQSESVFQHMCALYDSMYWY